jgi:shikimate dehydrogenase
MTRLAVLGSPIAHSLSPALHRAAFAAQGLDWTYEAIEARGDDLPRLLADGFHGLSLTMPLKRDVLPLLDSVDATVQLTGGANTVLDQDGLHGFNTDVAGIIRALARGGVTALENVHVLGSGATAASVIAAAYTLGASRVTVFARTVANAEPLVELAATLEIELTVRPLGAQDRSLVVPELVANTLPGHAELDLAYPEAIRRESVLFAVAYHPWPGRLARDWFAVDGTVVDGLDMLIEQALVQERIFVGGSPALELADEERVLGAMRAAVSR